MSLERSEDALSRAGLAAAETLRVAELAAFGLAALLFIPPLLILAVLVVVPAIALAGLVAAVAGTIALPVLAVRRFHRHRAAHPHRLLRLAGR